MHSVFFGCFLEGRDKKDLQLEYVHFVNKVAHLTTNELKVKDLKLKT